MAHQQQIRELQEKAFAGDTEALDLYNTFVEKGEAPAIYFNKQQTDLEMYKKATQEKKSSLFGDVDPDKLHEAHKSPLTLMSAGYESHKQDTDQTERKAGESYSFDGQKVNRELSPMEKMSAGYSDTGKQLTEANVNPNDIIIE
ncbi:hypothetical protein [Halobacillus sp. A5]|uniref:hypothetical protein n=1 Tax=Halobacillus sp. A5 TaxID=2880263 RepID=UPI0020A63B56|nr:hypothetical protein [Halobacillus sp. A5]MCP3026896.1 hypothetical protein [Halobacillus sp. A5]